MGSRLNWALRDYGPLWEASVRKPGAHTGFPRFSAGLESQVGGEHEGKSNPRRLWGKEKYEAAAGFPKGMLLEPGCHRTPAGVAELCIRACRGPVLAEPAASWWFVRGSLPNKPLLIRTRGPSESGPHNQGLLVNQYPARCAWILLESLLPASQLQCL